MGCVSRCVVRRRKTAVCRRRTHSRMLGRFCRQVSSRSVCRTPVSGLTLRFRMSTLSTCGLLSFGYLFHAANVTTFHGRSKW